MADTSSIDLYVYGKQDDASLRQQLISIAQTFECRPEMQEWIKFFSDPANIPNIEAAKARYGMPPRNRQATKSGALFGRWTDYCDWYDIYRFYYYAKLDKDYPTLKPNQEVCYSLSGYINLLREEKVMQEKNYTLANDKEKFQLELEALNDKFAEYNMLYSNLTCDEYKKQQEEIKSNLLKEEQKQKAVQRQEAVFKQTATTSGGGTKLAIYVFGSVAALIGIMILAKKS